MHTRSFVSVVAALALVGCLPTGADPSDTDPIVDTDVTPALALDGDPTSPAVDAIPDLDLPEPDLGDYTDEDGVLVSHRVVALVFADTTTVADANALLADLDAEILGGVRDGGLLVVRLPDRSLADATALEETLAADPRLDGAALDVAGHDDDRLPAYGADTRYDWSDPDKGEAVGNWGLMALRAPAVWNLNDFVLRSRTQNVCAAVAELRDADTNHPDLAVTGTDGSGDHATHVAGILGARSGNRTGVVAVHPWHHQVTTFRGSTDVTYTTNTLATTTANRLKTIAANTCIKVVNESSGYNGALPTLARMDRGGRVVVTSVEKLLKRQGRDDLILMFSAGNATKQDSRRNSEGANAAGRHGGRYFAVEAVGSDGKLGGFSNTSGSISAPGVCIRSTEAIDAVNFDQEDGSVCASEDSAAAPDTRYATVSGTSQAAPMAAGVASGLLKLDPTLKSTDIRTLLAGAATTRKSDGAPRIDFFAAVIGIDTLRNNRVLQRALVDVDDGTADGNLRETAVDTERDPDTIHTPGKRRGDGKVDARDLRAFRDAWLQDWEALAVLDGDGHFKRDLNVDGCLDGTPVDHPVDVERPSSCASAPDEEVFSRFDFNGNGILDYDAALAVPEPTGLAPFKVDPDTVCAGLSTPGCRRDLDVLADPMIWDPSDERIVLTGHDASGLCGSATGGATPPAGWSDTDLGLDRDGDGFIDYMTSIDLHLDTGDADPDHGLIVKSDIEGVPYFSKCRHDAFDGVVSAPVFYADATRVHIDYAETSGTERRQVSLSLQAFPGEDFGGAISWDGVELASTSRGDGDDVFLPWEQLEARYRTEAAGPYAVFSAPTLAELEELIWEEAVDEILPTSLVGGWLGDAVILSPGWTWDCVSVDFEGGCDLYEGVLWGALMSGS